ncbi:MAG: hypothetical protein AAF798_20165 [Bacteroidota bacterium]
MQIKHSYPLLLWAMLLSSFLSAQDTIVTNYPNTDQRWEKVFDEGQKVAENIYYEDASPWMTVQYEPAKVENWKWYYNNGNPYFEATYVNDLLQGTYQIWYENGQLAESLRFKDHLEDGAAVFYHPNGQIAMQGTYQNGEMIGTWQFFDPTGQPASGAWEWSFAASPDQLRVRGQLQAGRAIGKWQYSATTNQGLASQKRFWTDFGE